MNGYDRMMETAKKVLNEDHDKVKWTKKHTEVSDDWMERKKEEMKVHIKPKTITGNELLKDIHDEGVKELKSWLCYKCGGSAAPYCAECNTFVDKWISMIEKPF